MALDLENSGASALTNSSLQGYGVPPNPQLFTEAQSTGSITDVANAAGSGDPIFGNIIPIVPQSTNTTASQTDPSDKSFVDEVVRHGGRSALMILPSDMGKLVDFFQKTSTDQGLGQAWQHQLQDAGYLDHSHPADGNWDQATTQAYQQYLFNRYLPDAVYSTDAGRKATAAYLLSQLAPSLGLGPGPFDISTMNGQDEKTKKTILEGWVSTQPTSGDPRHAISQYADSYSDAALPKGVADLKEPGFFGKLVADVGRPIVGPDVGADERATQLRKELTATDLQALAPQIQAAVDNKGYFSEAMDAEGRLRNNLQLATAYLFGQANPMLDPETKLAQRNPWDAAVAAEHGASAHQDNVVAGLLGDQWVKDHSTSSSWMGAAASFVDPTLLLGPITRGASLATGLDASMVREAALSANGDRIQHVVSINASNTFQRMFQPARWQSKFVREAAVGIVQNPEHNAVDLAHYLDLPEVDPEQLPLVKKLFFEEDGLTRKTMTDDEAQKAIQELYGGSTRLDKHYLSMVSNIGTAYNHRAHLSALEKTNLDAAGGASKAKQLMYIGSLKVRPSMMTFTDADSVMEEGHTINEWGRLIGMSTDEINAHVNQFMNFPEQRVAVAQRFYQDVISRMSPEQLKRFQAAKQRAKQDVSWNALGRHYEQVESKGTELSYAPDPKTGEEISTVQRKPAEVPSELQSHLDDTIGKINDRYVQEITDWWEKKTGKKLSRGMSKQAQEEFEADPKNASFVDEIKSDMEEYGKVRQAADFPFGQTESRPLYSTQMASVFVRPGNTYHLVQAIYPTLAKVEGMEKVANLAEWNGIWKALAISRPSTAIRAMLGDDVMRYATELAMMGSPTAAANAIAHVLWNREGGAAGIFTKSVLGGSASGVRQIGRAAKLRSMMKERRRILESAKAGLSEAQVALDVARKDGTKGDIALAKTRVEDAKKAKDEAQANAEMSDQDKLTVLGIQDLWKAIGESGYLTDLFKHDRNGLINFSYGDPGYREALEQAYRKLRNAPEVGVWAKAKVGTTAQSQRAAQNALIKWLKSSDEGKELASSRAIEWRDYHTKESMTIQKNLDDLDQRMAFGEPGGATGNEMQYKALPHTDRKTGTARDAVISQIKLHDRRARDNTWAKQWARQVDEHLTKMTQYGPAMKWLNGEPMKQEELDQWFRSPDLRHTMPIVQARRPSVFASTAMQRAVQKVTRPILDHIFQPMIQGSRAYGAERMRQWWYAWAKHNFGDTWDDARIERFSIGKARQWMLNNTYQGTRTVTDMSMRNFFPFVGATLSMDRFFMSQIRAHPWMAGLLAKGGIKAEDAANQKANNLDLGSWMFGGSDHLNINPAYPFFYGAEGIGAGVPGTGPLLTLFSDALRQDAGLNNFISQIPGYSTAYAPTLLPGAGGFAANLASDISMATTGKALSLGPIAPAGRSQDDYQAMYDKKERELTADHNGQIPTDAEIRGAVAKDLLVKDVGGFLLPIQAHGVDVDAEAIKKARTEYDAAPDVASKIKVLQNNPGHPALLLLMTDHNTPPADLMAADPGLKDAYDKTYSAMQSAMPAGQQPTSDQVWATLLDQVQAQSPWMQPYLTSIYESKAAKPTSLDEFLSEQTSGNLHVQGPGEYTASLEQNYQRSMGYQVYRAQYMPMEQSFKNQLDQMQLSGISTSDPQYVQLRQQQSLALGALKSQIATLYPAWDASFKALGGDRSIGGEEIASAPIRSLTAWSLMQTPGTDNELRVPMQQVKQFVDQTAARLLNIKQAGGTSAETTQALGLFHQQLSLLVDQYPGLSDILDLYHFGRWQDFAQVEEAQLAAGQGL